jgi:hypothetical protein
MGIGRLVLAILTVAVWGCLLLETLGYADLLSGAVTVPLVGTIASVWIAFFSQRRLSVPASVVLQVILCLIGGFFVLVVMASSAG